MRALCGASVQQLFFSIATTGYVMAHVAVPSLHTLWAQPDTVPWVKFRPRKTFKEGLQSQMQRLAWFDEMWSELSSEERDLLILNIERWHWSNTLVGVGSRDQIQCQIVTG